MRENIRPLIAEEIQLLFEEMKGNIIYDISLCSLLTGMRLGEITGLKESYVDFKNKKLHIEKSLQYIQETGEFVFQDTKSEKRTFEMEETLLFLLKKRKNEVEQMKKYYGDKYNDDGYLFLLP